MDATVLQMIGRAGRFAWSAPVVVLALAGCARDGLLEGLTLPEMPAVQLPAARIPELPDVAFGDALDWAMPIDLDGILVKVPAPDGLVEHCRTSNERLAELNQGRESVRTLACYRSRPGAARERTAELTALAGARPVPASEFDAYKTALGARARSLASSFSTYNVPAADPPSASAAPVEVLRILSDGKDWVVHAIVRRRGAAVEPAVVTSVLVRGRLLYLTLLEPHAEATDWNGLTALAEDWAEAVLRRTLWERRQ